MSARIASRSSTRESGGSPPSLSPRSIEPREAWMRTPSSRAAATSASTRPGDAAREDVVVVEHGRAPRERELGDAGPRGGRDHLLVDARPRRVERLQPREQVGLLRPGARERLVEVVVRVDQAGRDDGAVQVDALVGRGRLPAPDGRDAAGLDEQPAGIELGARVVLGDDDPVDERAAHVAEPKLPWWLRPWPPSSVTPPGWRRSPAWRPTRSRGGCGNTPAIAGSSC